MKIRIGSRGSKLAVTQAAGVADLLRRHDKALEIELVQISTTGDRDANSAPSAIGGKGVFVKEIEDALLAKSIDLAVHSLKDVPQMLPPGLRLAPPPAREDARDALISRFGELLRELPKGSTVGTGSPRRSAQIRHRYAKRLYRIEPIRGNVETRLKKLRDGAYDAIVLAAAGLSRLGLSGEISEILEPEEMLPAPCQGCLGLEIREGDTSLLALLTAVSDFHADITSRAERAFLQGLGGDCMIPVGAYSVLEGETLKMKAVLLDLEATRSVTAEMSGSASQPEFVGAQLAGQLLFDGGSEILLGTLPSPGA